MRFYLYRIDRETGAILNLVDSFSSESEAHKQCKRMKRIWKEDTDTTYIVCFN